MESPIILIVGLIQYFILSIIVGGIIFNISFQLKKHIIFSLIGCLAVYTVRSIFLIFSLPIGISTLINLILTIFIFKYVFNIETWKKSFTLTTLIYLIMTINEALTLKPIENFLHTNIQSILQSNILHFKALIIQNLGLLMIMLIVYIVKKYAIDRRIVSIDN